MKKVLVLHGPNLNMLGKREPHIYGNFSLSVIDQKLIKEGQTLGMEVYTLQSNHEGGLIDSLQQANDWANGVILNPGGYTHTSVALRDAVASISIPVIEVHLSNVDAREDFRRTSLIAPVCVGRISGFGWRSYWLALQFLALQFAEPAE